MLSPNGLRLSRGAEYHLKRGFVPATATDKACLEYLACFILFDEAQQAMVAAGWKPATAERILTRIALRVWYM